MEDLSKTIKKLEHSEYDSLLKEISGNKKNKPFMVLEALRKESVDDSSMMEMLQVNRSTYYTLKSRLNDKVAAILSKKVDNPISVLMEEVARVPANLYGTNKVFAIRALKDLEKQLLEYDLSNELITVYKTLARLNMYGDDYVEYERLYSQRVAFSLALVKVEDLFYKFNRLISIYSLTREEKDLEKVREVLREMFNITELYESHRMFVMYNIVRIYFMTADQARREGLRSQELEVEKVLNEINEMFGKYTLDTFYQNIKPLTDLLFFEYYQTCDNQVRADHYHQKVIGSLPDLSKKHIMAFYVVQFLNSKMAKYLVDQDLISLERINDQLEDNFDIDKGEIYNYVSYVKYQAVCKFYKGDYSAAAKTIYDMRNEVSTKNFLYTDVECKLFQALQYCILGEESLCTQMMQSIKRQIKETDREYDDVELFIKLMKTALKPADFRKKIKKLNEIWKNLEEMNSGSSRMLWYVKLDESVLRRMANPIK